MNIEGINNNSGGAKKTRKAFSSVESPEAGPMVHP